MVTHGPLGLRVRRFKAGPKGMELDGYYVINLEDHPMLLDELQKVMIRMDTHTI